VRSNVTQQGLKWPDGCPPGPKIDVTWIDSASDEPWVTSRNHTDVVEIHTCGWLFYEDDKQIKVCGSYYWSHGDITVGEAIAIPKVAILTGSCYQPAKTPSGKRSKC